MKDIPGYEGIYAADEDGNIYSLPRIIKKTINGKEFEWHTKLNLQQPATRRDGYLQVSLRRNGKNKSLLAHRLIAMAFLGITTQEINHIDGDKKNNKLNNLEISNRSHNIKHAFKLGLKSHKGKKHPRYFVTDEMKVQILELLKTGLSQEKIGKLFGICQAKVSHIKLRG